MSLAFQMGKQAGGGAQALRSIGNVAGKVIRSPLFGIPAGAAATDLAQQASWKSGAPEPHTATRLVRDLVGGVAMGTPSVRGFIAKYPRAGTASVAGEVAGSSVLEGMLDRGDKARLEKEEQGLKVQGQENLNKGTLQTSRAEVDRLMAAAAAEKQKADAATLEATARAGQATAETKDVGARTQARTVFQNTAAVGGNLLGKLDRLATPRNAMIGAGVVGGGMLLWKLGKMIEQRHKLQTLQARKPAPGSLSPAALKAVAREAAAFELGQRTPWKEDELQRIAATSAKTASVSPYFQLGLYTGKG